MCALTTKGSITRTNPLPWRPCSLSLWTSSSASLLGRPQLGRLGLWLRRVAWGERSPLLQPCHTDAGKHFYPAPRRPSSCASISSPLRWTCFNRWRLRRWIAPAFAATSEAGSNAAGVRRDAGLGPRTSARSCPFSRFTALMSPVGPWRTLRRRLGGSCLSWKAVLRPCGNSQNRTGAWQSSSATRLVTMKIHCPRLELVSGGRSVPWQKWRRQFRHELKGLLLWQRKNMITVRVGLKMIVSMHLILERTRRRENFFP
mmetsp:Transcript_56376/g.168749  ORF Transcript_56376/g.168749 Transcript_56376/m.168749 type:complete len:258 (+) Transcript_56376:263-1036(+)